MSAREDDSLPAGFQLGRRLLARWLKPRILGADADAWGLPRDSSVCYVLANHSLADLMVTDQACRSAGLPLPGAVMAGLPAESRSFFFLSRGEGRFLQRRSHRSASPRLLRLIEAVRTGRVSDIQLVPVSLFWGQAPDMEHSIWRTWLSDNWMATGRLRRLLAILLHRRHLVVQFSAPVSLARLLAEEPSADRQQRKLVRLLRIHFRRRKQAILGPDLSHRRTLLNQLIASSEVQATISRLTEEGADAPELQALARRHAAEIVSDQSYAVIRFFYSLLTWLWNTLYDGIAVNQLAPVRELAGTHGIVYVPCHRSHIDYLLLSYVLYVNGLPPPHIAAGNNLDLPLLGGLLRRAGAFFMRRSFSGDPLYRAVFDEYIHVMIERGYAIEYFIEGGRSRTGRMLPPRTGMLAMTLRNHLRSRNRPLAFVPVYFGYEKIIEVNTYLQELPGKTKERESWLDLFRAMGILRLSFGQVRVNFGTPVSADAFLAEHGFDTGSASPPREIPFSTSVALGNRLAVAINRAAAVNPVNLVAAILLATPRQIIDESRLLECTGHWLELLRNLHGTDGITLPRLEAPALVAEAGRVLGLSRRSHDFGVTIAAEGTIAKTMTYYRNNILHLLVLPSLVARVLERPAGTTTEALFAACGALYPFLAAELYLPWSTDQAGEVQSQVVQRLQALGLVSSAGDRLLAATEPAARESLRLIAKVVEPSLDRYCIALHVRTAHSPADENDWANLCRLVAENLSITQGMNSPQFFEKSLFARFISTLRDLGILDAGVEAGADLAPLLQALSACQPGHRQLMIENAVDLVLRSVKQG